MKDINIENVYMIQGKGNKVSFSLNSKPLLSPLHAAASLSPRVGLSLSWYWTGYRPDRL